MNHGGAPRRGGGGGGGGGGGPTTRGGGEHSSAPLAMASDSRASRPHHTRGERRAARSTRTAPNTSRVSICSLPDDDEEKEEEPIILNHEPEDDDEELLEEEGATTTTTNKQQQQNSAKKRLASSSCTAAAHSNRHQSDDDGATTTITTTTTTTTTTTANEGYTHAYSTTRTNNNLNLLRRKEREEEDGCCSTIASVVVEQQQQQQQQQRRQQKHHHQEERYMDDEMEEDSSSETLLSKKRKYDADQYHSASARLTTTTSSFVTAQQTFFVNSSIAAAPSLLPATFSSLPLDFLVELVENYVPFHAPTIAALRLTSRSLLAAVRGSRWAGTARRRDLDDLLHDLDDKPQQSSSSSIRNASSFDELRPLLRLMPRLERIDFTLWTHLNGPELAYIAEHAPHLSGLKLHLPREDARLPHPAILSGDDVASAIRRLPALADVDLSHVFSLTSELYGAIAGMSQRLRSITIGRTMDRIPVALVSIRRRNGNDGAEGNDAEAMMTEEEDGVDDDADRMTVSNDEESSLEEEEESDGDDDGVDGNGHNHHQQHASSIVLHSMRELSFWRPQAHIEHRGASAAGWYPIASGHDDDLERAAVQNATLLPILLRKNCSSIEEIACVDLPAIPNPGLWISNNAERFTRLTKLQLLSCDNFTLEDAEGLFGTQHGSSSFSRVPALRFLELSGSFDAPLVNRILASIGAGQLRSIMLLGCKSIDNTVLEVILNRHGDVVEEIFLGRKLTCCSDDDGSVSTLSSRNRRHSLHQFIATRHGGHLVGDDHHAAVVDATSPQLENAYIDYMRAVEEYWANVSQGQLVRLIAQTPRLRSLHLESCFAPSLLNLPLAALGARASHLAPHHESGSGRDTLTSATFMRPVMRSDALVEHFVSGGGGASTSKTLPALKQLNLTHAVVLAPPRGACYGGGTHLLSALPRVRSYYSAVETLNISFSDACDTHLGAMLWSTPRLRSLYANRCSQLSEIVIPDQVLEELEVVQAVECERLRVLRIGASPRLQYVWMRGTPSGDRLAVVEGPKAISQRHSSMTAPPVACGKRLSFVCESDSGSRSASSTQSASARATSSYSSYVSVCFSVSRACPSSAQIYC